MAESKQLRNQELSQIGRVYVATILYSILNDGYSMKLAEIIPQIKSDFILDPVARSFYDSAKHLLARGEEHITITSLVENCKLEATEEAKLSMIGDLLADQGMSFNLHNQAMQIKQLAAGTVKDELLKDLQNSVDNNKDFLAALKRSEHTMEILGADSLPTSVNDQMENFWNMVYSPRNIPVSTGFKQLDDALDGGLYPGIMSLGAVSSAGKTTFALQVADNVARKGKDVLLFSLEMSANQIIARTLSRMTMLLSKHKKNEELASTSREILRGERHDQMSVEKYNAINEAGEDYRMTEGNHMRIISPDSPMTVEEICSTITTFITLTKSYPLVVIDYLQYIAPSDPRATDKANMDHKVQELRNLTKKYPIPIVLISSLSRAGYNESISMEFFKESGIIEYSSDVVLGMQLEGIGKAGFNINDAKAKYPRDIELVILKNRDSVTGLKLKYKYFTKYNYFTEVKIIPKKDS